MTTDQISMFLDSGRWPKEQLCQTSKLSTCWFSQEAPWIKKLPEKILIYSVGHLKKYPSNYRFSYLCQLLDIVLRSCLRGQGVRVRFSLFLFLMEENASYQKLFSGWKKIAPSQSYHILKSQKFIQLHCVYQLQSRFPKNQL